MKDNFIIKIETWHKPDLGTIENVSKQISTVTSDLYDQSLYDLLTVFFIFIFLCCLGAQVGQLHVEGCNCCAH